MNRLIGIYEKLYRCFGPQSWWPGDTPFEVAIGAILTQNTNWSNVEKAIRNLKNRDLLSPKGMHGLSVGILAPLIKPAGYFNMKAKRLKSFLAFLMDDYRGDMEYMKREDLDHLRKKLLRIHGIGPETADSILLYALGKPVFVVDAYTKRILARHGIIDEDTSYDDVQQLFHNYLEKNASLYNEYHALFVRLGKELCKKRKPQCRFCPLNDMPSPVYSEYGRLP